MRGLPLLMILICVAGPARADPVSRDPAQVPAGLYELDPRHTSVLAKIPHMGGFSKFTLRFGKVSGDFTYDPSNWAATQATITAQAASVDTGLPDFNRTVVGYFQPARHPTITFVTRRIEAQDGQGTITGDLTLLGQTRPMTLQANFNGVGPGLLGVGTRLGFSAVGRIRRSEFGLTAAREFAGDDVDLVIEVEFVKK